MYAIIVGCGRIGSQLASSLAGEGHNVVVVDRRKEAFRDLGPGFNGVTVHGSGIDEDVLREAGVEGADALAAVTSDDNVNLMTAQVARLIFAVPRVVARIVEPHREKTYHEFGVETACPTSLGTLHIRRALISPGPTRLLPVGAGELHLMSIRCGPALAQKTVAEIEIEGKFRVAAVIAPAEAVVPTGATVLQPGWELIAAVRLDAMHAVAALCGVAPRGRRDGGRRG